MATTDPKDAVTGRTRADTVIAVDKGKQRAEPEAVAPLRAAKHESSATQQLPMHLRLKGAENYTNWKRNFMDLLTTNDLQRYFIDDPTDPKPKEITADYFPIATRDEKLDWKDWKAGEAKARLLLNCNILQSPTALVSHLFNPKDIWELFESTYEGSSGTLITIGVYELMDMDIQSFKSVEDFIVAYRRSVDKLNTLLQPESIPKALIENVFLFKVSKKFTIWAERQRANMRQTGAQRPSFDELMNDLIDENRSKNAGKGAASSSSSAMASQQNKGKKGGNSGQKKCKHCGQSNPNHEAEDCLDHNTEKRKAWEAEHKKKWIPRAEWLKNKNKGKKPSNSKNNDSDDDILNTGFMAQGIKPIESIRHVDSAKPKQGALLSLFRERWLADSGADGHVCNNLALFTDYQECDMRPVDTADGPIKPPGFGTVKLRVKQSTGDDFELILKDVVYMPRCPINLFGVGKLMRQNGGYVRPGRVIYLKKGVETELCAVDQNLHLIEVSVNQSACLLQEVPLPTGNGGGFRGALPARVTDGKKAVKALDIDLWHARLGHLGHENVCRTSTITKGIKIEGKGKGGVCEPCALAKPLRHTRKVATKRVFNVFDKVWVDTFMINPAGLNGHKYGIIFTDEATHCRWGYTFKHKNDAFECVKKMMALAKTQFEKEIKAWRMDGGREYSLSQLQELCDEVGSILELTTAYTPEQDGISERTIRIVIEKVRSVMIGQNIPGYLWPEIFMSIVKITNRTATSNLVDLTPIEAFMNAVDPPEGEDRKHQPFMGYLRVLGCKTYVLIPQELRQRSHKLEPRAEIGILVGYEGEHIYRVWIPGKKGFAGRIVRTSNARFDENGLITDVTAEGSAPNLDIQVPDESRGDMTYSAPLEVQNPSIGIEDEHVDFTSDVEVEETNEVGNSATFELHEPPPIHEEDEFFDFSQADIQPEEFEPPNVPNVDESEAEEAPEPAPEPAPEATKRAKKVWEPKPEFQRYTRSKGALIAFMNAFESTATFEAYIAQTETYQRVYAAAKVVTDEPQTLKEAMDSSDAVKWRAAIKAEYQAIQRKKTWTLKKRSEAKGHKILRGKLVFKKKRDKDGNIIKYKVRWVVRGFEQQYGRDYDQTYAGVCRSSTWKIILAIAAVKDWDIEQMDAVTAFLNSEIDTDVFIELPPMWKELLDLDLDGKDHEDLICQLLMALYGLKQSPRLWQKKLCATLIKLGFQPLKSDNCVYINKSGVVIVTYVDDMLITGPSSDEIAGVKKALMQSFEMEDLGPAAYFVGVRIVRDRSNRSITLVQDAYARKILKKYGVGKAVPTPMASDTLNQMVTNTGKASKEEILEYQSKMGSANYLSTHTRPDISFTCSVLSRFLVNPSKTHIDAANWLLRYIQGTVYMGIMYGGKALKEDTEKGTLHGYTDSDYAGDVELRRSTSGYVFYFGGGAISFQSKRQSITALSTTEAEYYGMYKAVMEATWLQYVFRELDWKSKDARRTKIYGDNKAALSLSENPEMHQRTKHIAVKYHYIREARFKGLAYYEYISTQFMAADGLTKPLGRLKHQEFIRQLRLQLVDHTGFKED